MNPALLEMIKPWLAQGARDALRMIGVYLLSKHVIQGGNAGLDAFIGAGMTLAGFGWGWFTTVGMVKLQAIMKKLTTPTVVPSVTPTIVKILLIAFLPLALVAMAGAVQAQTRDPIQQLNQKIKNDFTRANTQAKAVVNGTSTDPDVSCDFQLFIMLTPKNLESVMKKCGSDIHSFLADDTQRALDSAVAYPDNDGVSCLKPGLAILKAGIQTPGTPGQDAVPAVMNPDGTVKTPAIPAVLAVAPKDPGIVLLFQKFREFTLSGALTSCQTWINGPLQATIAAGANAVGNGLALGAAAVAIAPKIP